MKASIYSSLLALPFSLAGCLPRSDPGISKESTAPNTSNNEPKMQPGQSPQTSSPLPGIDVPKEGKAPNTFNHGTKMQGGQPPQTTNPLPAIFQPKDIDIPFGRLSYGKIMYFRPGEMNTKDGVSDTGVGVNDDAKQSACGIPDNAYSNSKVAIHPYWLKYAGLDRYCLQDVCVAFWTADGKADMISKVTDICSTDPEDPSHCASPEDIKLPRTKVQVLRHKTGIKWNADPQISGNEDTQKVYWYFSKCLGEAIVQDAYKGPGTDNWFATPPYPENNAEAVQASYHQWQNNQKSYPAKGWTTHQNGVTCGGHCSEKHTPVTDWVAGQEPEWEPIAGGEGFGKPHGKDVNQINAKYGA